MPGAAGADYYGRPSGAGFAGAYEPGAPGPSTAGYGGNSGMGRGTGAPALSGGGGMGSRDEAWQAQVRV